MPKLLQTAATHCFLSEARLSLAPFLLPLLRVCAAVCSRVGLLFMRDSVRQAACASSFGSRKIHKQSEKGSRRDAESTERARTRLVMI